MMQPPDGVVESFGARPPAVPASGGQGATWRADDLVLKPLDMPAEALAWLDGTARPLFATSGLRVCLPVRGRSGEFVVDGWTAFPYLEGSHSDERWDDVADVARRFAAALAGEERPAFVAGRTDAWARADRFAWGEEEDDDARSAPYVARLLAAREAIDAPSGIIHSDLAGNVLFDDALPPAVIDVTMSWRPVEYSVAIIAVDAVCFRGASVSLLDTISDDGRFAQLLIRALLFRVVTDVSTHRDVYGAYASAVAHVLA
jgi:uncharacterized protein (TIGR02569 family)